jgi:hypothetical protein
MKKKYQNNSKVKNFPLNKRYPSKISYTYASTTSQEIHSVACQIFGISYYISYQDLISVV